MLPLINPKMLVLKRQVQTRENSFEGTSFELKKSLAHSAAKINPDVIIRTLEPNFDLNSTFESPKN